MRLLFVLLLLLAAGAHGWKQCGPPSRRVVSVSGLRVENGVGDDSSHWVRVVVTGSATRAIPADAVLSPWVRLGAIKLPLPEKTLGHALEAGPFEYVYFAHFDAPSDMTVHVQLKVADAESQILCLRDIAIQL